MQKMYKGQKPPEFIVQSAQPHKVQSSDAIFNLAIQQ